MSEASAPVEPEIALAVRELSVVVGRGADMIRILRRVTFDVARGTMHGLVGETGSGKSMTAAAVTGTLPAGCRIEHGRIEFDGMDLATFTPRQFEGVCGRRIGMVFQNPRTALYPFATVARQMGVIAKTHLNLDKRQRRERILDELETVGIPDPIRVAGSYPHELSGGLAQRVVIAAALLSGPSLLVADEPTTGLDLTVQAQILELLADLQSQLSLSVLMITHDLSIVAQYCARVTVMLQGESVENRDKEALFEAPIHQYTARLLAASRLSRETLTEHGSSE